MCVTAKLLICRLMCCPTIVQRHNIKGVEIMSYNVKIGSTHSILGDRQCALV